MVDIPAGVSVIDRQTIEERGYNTLAEALSAIPGVRVSQSGGAGGIASVFVRGTNSDQVLVLIDGMPSTTPPTPVAQFNFGVDTLGDVERIEIIRGPMAALYGSGAIGGVINLIMRKGTQQGVHVTGDLAGGYPAQVRGILNASGIEGPLDYSLTFESQSQRGFDTTPQRMSIYTGMPQGYRDRVLTTNLGYTPVDGTRVSLLLRGRDGEIRFQQSRLPDIRRRQLHRHGRHSARPHRRHVKVVRWHFRNRRLRRSTAGRQALSAVAEPARPQPGIARTTAITAIAPTFSGTTRCT